MADHAKLIGTCRYAPSQSVETVTADLHSLLNALQLEFPGLKAELITRGQNSLSPQMPPFEVSRESLIVKVMNAAFEKVRGYPQPTGAIRPPAFYGTDAAHLAAAGMKGIVCGPGGEFNTMPDERVRKTQFLECIRIYMHVICDICEIE